MRLSKDEILNNFTISEFYYIINKKKFFEKYENDMKRTMGYLYLQIQIGTESMEKILRFMESYNILEEMFLTEIRLKKLNEQQ
jgi:hypothetical protein